MTSPNTLPANPDAERWIFGGIFADPVRFFDVAAIVSAEDFFDHRHARVFAAIGALLAEGGTVNEQTVRLKLGASFAEVGAEYLGELAYSFADPAALETHARAVRDLSTRREMMRTALGIAAAGANVEQPTSAYLEHAESEVFRVIGRRVSSTAYRPLSAVVDELEAESDRLAESDAELPGMPTGIPTLDRVTRGLRRGHLVVIGGGTSDGKSALAGTIAKHASERGHRGLVFTMEMTQADWVRRLVAAEGIPVADQEDPHFLRDQGNRRRLTATRARVAALPIEVVYQPGITVTQVRTWCRRFAARAPLDFVVVDYLDLMGSHEKHERHDLDLGARTKGLLALAAELDCTVILLAQLNREAFVVGAGSKRKSPTVHNLAGSSKIANDAHLVLLIHSPTASDDGDDGTREIIVAKQRGGMRYRKIPARLLGPRFTFVEVDDRPPPAPAHFSDVDPSEELFQ